MQVNWRGTFIHELFHAFGIAHTHRRQDRDQYIRILWNNIEDKSKSQFKKCTTCSIPKDVPYECNSIMHYGQNQAGLRIRVFWSDPDLYFEEGWI